MILTAYSIFHEGDRVRSTPKAIKNGVFKKQVSGVVTGFGRESYLVRVLVDGKNRRGNRHQPETYHMDFWEREEAQ